MPEMTRMTTRRSARNLQQLDMQPQSGHPDNDEPVRYYVLNCDKAMKKTGKACSVGYLVAGEEKWGNHFFSFSTAMYELNRNRLAEHFHWVKNNPNANINIKFKDILDKAGLS